MDKLPNKIRHWRKECGLTQGQLGEKIGASTAQVSDLERGTTQLTVYWMERIADAMNIRKEQLLNGVDDESLPRNAEEIELLRRWRLGNTVQKEQVFQLMDVVMPFDAQPSLQRFGEKGQKAG